MPFSWNGFRAAAENGPLCVSKWAFSHPDKVGRMTVDTGLCRRLLPPISGLARIIVLRVLIGSRSFSQGFPRGSLETSSVEEGLSRNHRLKARDFCVSRDFRVARAQLLQLVTRWCIMSLLSF